MKGLMGVPPIICLLALMAGCAAKTVTLTGFNSGESAIMRVGDRFDIALESNPTTGFGWQVDHADESVVIISAPMFTPRSDAIGAAGSEVFHTMVVGEGKTTIRLVYRRPWEEDAPPLRVWTLKLEAIR